MTGTRTNPEQFGPEENSAEKKILECALLCFVSFLLEKVLIDELGKPSGS